MARCASILLLSLLLACPGFALGEIEHGTFLPFNVPGSNSTVLSGINNTDQIVGTFADASLYSHGFLYSAGQLGDGTTTDRHTPVQVVGLTRIYQVSADYDTSCALKHDDTAWCWGAGGSGRLGYGSTQSRLTPVQVQAIP